MACEFWSVRTSSLNVWITLHKSAINQLRYTTPVFPTRETMRSLVRVMDCGIVWVDGRCDNLFVLQRFLGKGPSLPFITVLKLSTKNHPIIRLTYHLRSFCRWKYASLLIISSAWIVGAHGQTYIIQNYVLKWPIAPQRTVSTHSPPGNYH